MNTKITRIQAFLLHLFSSTLIMLVISLFLYFVLYPGQLLFATNGIGILKIILLVDVVLGPVVMLIIFNPKKKSLKFDVLIVLIIQLGFLSYGCWSLYAARPAYIVFNGKEFEITSANEIEDVNLKKVENQDFKNLPSFGPLFVGAILPKDEREKGDVTFTKALGAGIKTFPQYFVSYDQQKMLAAKNGFCLNDLELNDQAYFEKLKNFIDRESEKHLEIVFVPLVTSKQNFYVAIDKKDGSIIKILK